MAESATPHSRSDQRLPAAPTSTVPAWELLLAFFAALALAALATALDDWPAPRVFDEFSQILAGGTFSRGRLTNPPHPLPDFFETIHVLQRPTYSSKYFPGHGLALALGIVLGGGARLGQWLAFAGMAPALLWMLRGWLSRRAALIGTALTILLLADTPWASGYWGSALTVLGSALLFGAFPRLLREPRVRTAVLMGCGVVLLAFTRPFEGAALCLVPALFFAVWVVLPGRERARRLLHVALPTILVVGVGGAFLALHNRAVTGDPLRSGYAAYEERAPGAPPFVWQELVTTTRPMRANQTMRYRIDVTEHQRLRAWWSGEMRTRLLQLTVPYYLPHLAFAFPFLLAPVALRDRRLWIVALSTIPVAAAIGVSSFYLPHYVAPALPPLVLLYALGCGVASRLRIGTRRVGRLACGALLLLFGALAARDLVVRDRDEIELAADTHWSRRREALERHLRAHPRSHLIFVRYGDSYQSQDEWVQNSADLAGTRVLWAHDLGEAANARLMAVEPARTPWRLVIESGRVAEPMLAPYADAGRASPIAPHPLRGELVTPPY